MRSIVVRQNGGEHSVSMFTGKVQAQKIDVSQMTRDQVAETVGLSIQWMREGTHRVRKYDASKEPAPAHTAARRKARTIEDINLSKKVAEYASQMSDFTARKREARQKSRLETLNKMLQEEGK